MAAPCGCCRCDGVQDVTGEGQAQPKTSGLAMSQDRSCGERHLSGPRETVEEVVGWIVLESEGTSRGSGQEPTADASRGA